MAEDDTPSAAGPPADAAPPAAEPPPARPKVARVCTRCGATKPAKLLPKGWDDPNGEVLCNKCLPAVWPVRAFPLPIVAVLAQVVNRKEVPVRLDVLDAVRPAFRLATDLSNWAARELLRHDVVRLPDMDRLPPYQPLELYSHWNRTAPPSSRAAWVGATGSAGSILRFVGNRWAGAGRLACVWRGDARAACYNFPQPYPVRVQEWKARWRAHPGGDLPLVEVVLPGVAGGFPGGRYLLQLDRGPDRRRHLADFDRLVTGAAVGAELRITPIERGGRLVGAKVTFVGRFRQASADRGALTAVVRSGPEAFLTVEIPDRDNFILFAGHLRGVVAWGDRLRFQSSNDLKYDHRVPADRRRRWVRNARARVVGQRRRLDAELKQAVREVCNYVARQNCGELVLDLRNKQFLPHWPWFATATQFAHVCAGLGITLRDVPADDAAAAPPDPAAGPDQPDQPA